MTVIDRDAEIDVIALLEKPGYPVLEAQGPIFPIRGLPADLSTELRQWSALFEDATGHSWLSVKELHDFDSKQRPP